MALDAESAHRTCKVALTVKATPSIRLDHVSGGIMIEEESDTFYSYNPELRTATLHNTHWVLGNTFQWFSMLR